MKRLLFTFAVLACLTLPALGQKESKSEKPVIDQTPEQMNQRVAEVKRRTGRNVDPNKMGTPVSVPKRRGRCRYLAKEEWNLVFSDYPSEYGGTVCTRR